MNLSDPDHREFLTEAIKEQPIGTCCICSTPNIHVFETTAIGPGSEGIPPKCICLDCFLKAGHDGVAEESDASKTKRMKAAIAKLPTFVKSVISFQRVAFLFVTLGASAVFACTGFYLLCQGDTLTFLGCIIMAWLVQYALHLLNLQWHRLRDHDED